MATSVENYEESQPILGENTPPRGSKKVYIAFMLLGLGTLLPWNFFITADSYWQYKFRNVSDDSWNPGDTGTTELQNLYTPFLVCLSQVTNFVVLFLNAILSHLIHHKKRLSVSFITMIALFTATTAMVKMDSDSWQMTFFVLTMVIIVLINASGAVFQGGLYGLAGMFPERHMCAVVGGQSLGGVFASVARILSIAFGATSVSSAFIYFLIAVVVMIFTFAIYLHILKTAYFRHYAEVSVPVDNEDPEKIDTRPSGSSSWTIFKQIWPLGVSVSFVFLVTLSVFPVVCVRIVSNSANLVWRNKYFQPVVTFLLFNVGDYIGRQAAGWIMFPKRGSKLLYVLTLARVMFIPLFLFCNHEPNSVPVWFTSDYVYVLIMMAFALSNGYCATLCLMYAPRMVAEENAEKAGGLMAAMLGLGLLLGAGLSFAFAML